METKDILKSLREKKGYTIQELSKQIGMPYTMCREYESGNRNLGMSAAIKFADFYEVTIDYLLGREPLNNPLAGMKIYVNEDNFCEKFKEFPEWMQQILVDAMENLSKAAKEAQEGRKPDYLAGELEDMYASDLEAKEDAG